MDKGFTLIELMIVVAIIGILAAVAVPGFIRYIKDSKTAEAKENLKSIGDGALSFFQTEHPIDGSSNVVTKQFPSDKVCVTMSGVTLSCEQKTPIPSALPETGTKVGTKKSDATLWIGEPWKSLKFSISKAFYYSYGYTGTGAIDGGDSTFTASAGAALDKTSADSCFKLSGEKDGDSGEALVHTMIDLSESASPCVWAL